MQVENGSLGVLEHGHHRVDGRAQMRLILLPVRMPGRHVRVPAADHLVLVVEPDDLPLVMSAPGCAVEQRAQFLGIVVAEHEVERDAERPQACIRKVEPFGEPFTHQAQEQIVESAVRLHRLELAGIGAVRVIAMVGDELLEGNQLGAFDDVVVRADEATHPPSARCVHDRLDRLAGDVATEDQDLGLVDLRGVDELAEAHVRSVQVADEVDSCFRHVRPEPPRAPGARRP